MITIICFLSIKKMQENLSQFSKTRIDLISFMSLILFASFVNNCNEFELKIIIYKYWKCLCNKRVLISCQATDSRKVDWTPNVLSFRIWVENVQRDHLIYTIIWYRIYKVCFKYQKGVKLIFCVLLRGKQRMKFVDNFFLFKLNCIVHHLPKPHLSYFKVFVLFIT